MNTYEYMCRRCRKQFELIESIPPTGGDPECAECIAEEIMKTVFDLARIPVKKREIELMER